MECPCGCGRDVSPSLGQFVDLTRETGASLAALARLRSLLAGDQVGGEVELFMHDSASLHRRLVDRCHGQGGIIGGVRLGRDAVRWRNAFAAHLTALDRLDHEYVERWPIAVESWPSSATKVGREAPWDVDRPVTVDEVEDAARFRELHGIVADLIARTDTRLHNLSEDDVYQWLRAALDAWRDNPSLIQPHIQLAASGLARTAESQRRIMAGEAGDRRSEVDLLYAYLLGRCLLGTQHRAEPVEGDSAEMAAHVIEHSRFFIPGQLLAWPQVAAVVDAFANRRWSEFPEIDAIGAKVFVHDRMDEGVRLAFSEGLLLS